jgi:hypothetical protein
MPLRSPKTSAMPVVLLAGLCGWGLAAVLSAGCNLPGIPLEGLEPPEELAEAGSKVCAAGQRTCRYQSVQICADDGTDFVLEACPLDTSCSQGQCVPIGDRCDDGQPFGLSVSELVFESTDLLKTQTRSVTLTNCGSIPLLVQRVDLRSPERSDGMAVFVFAEERPLLRELSPGESLDIGVVYHPDGGQTQDRGFLEVGVIAEGYVQAQVPLRTRTYCATTAPRRDLFLQPVDERVEEVLYLHNCGTEPLTLRRIGTEGGGLSALPMELPFVLEPGHFLRAAVHIEPPQAGLWTGSVRFELDETERFVLEDRALQTELRAVFYRTPCRERPAVTVTTQGMTASGYAEPFAPLKLVPSGVGNAELAMIDVAVRPERSRARVKSEAGELSFEPDVVGAYELLVHVLDGDGRLSCEPALVGFDVRPSAPLYVELTWETIDDKIPDDEGMGRGMDLNLHMLATDAQGTVTPVWNDVAHDCRQYYWRTGQVCPGLEGRFVSTSRSGARPEALSIGAPEGQRFQIGVHALNAYGFSGAHAFLRVYRDGQLHPGFADTRIAFHRTGEFWPVGALDGTTGEGRATNLPQPFPQMP